MNSQYFGVDIELNSLDLDVTTSFMLRYTYMFFCEIQALLFWKCFTTRSTTYVLLYLVCESHMMDQKISAASSIVATAVI